MLKIYGSTNVFRWLIPGFDKDLTWEIVKPKYLSFFELDASRLYDLLKYCDDFGIYLTYYESDTFLLVEITYD